ncbi:hypothetical protein BJ170DRAFT_74052 [Xylariales sp. AK1849]|nr:hypothetical protein BJ170DRAFT_74052 [Xylariales sp. AK1849]
MALSNLWHQVMGKTLLRVAGSIADRMTPIDAFTIPDEIDRDLWDPVHIPVPGKYHEVTGDNLSDPDLWELSTSIDHVEHDSPDIDSGTSDTRNIGAGDDTEASDDLCASSETEDCDITQESCDMESSDDAEESEESWLSDDAWVSDSPGVCDNTWASDTTWASDITWVTEPTSSNDPFLIQEQEAEKSGGFVPISIEWPERKRRYPKSILKRKEPRYVNAFYGNFGTVLEIDEELGPYYGAAMFMHRRVERCLRRTEKAREQKYVDLRRLVEAQEIYGKKNPDCAMFIDFMEKRKVKRKSPLSVTSSYSS